MGDTMPRSLTGVNVYEISDTFLVKTQSGSIYTLSCFADENHKVFISGGSHNRPAELVTLEDGQIATGQFMVFGPDNGWSTSVTAIYNITDLEPHEIAEFGKQVL
jgi:hypothetical protein